MLACTLERAKFSPLRVHTHTYTPCKGPSYSTRSVANYFTQLRRQFRRPPDHVRPDGSAIPREEDGQFPTSKICIRDGRKRSEGGTYFLDRRIGRIRLFFFLKGCLVVVMLENGTFEFFRIAVNFDWYDVYEQTYSVAKDFFQIYATNNNPDLTQIQ